MTWIKSDSGLSRSTKFFSLVEKLKVEQRDAFWYLHHLWYWCSDQHPEGILKDVSDVAIASMAQWPGDAKAFVEALIHAGFIDREPGQLVIHDWINWRADPARHRARRTSDKRPTNVVSPPSSSPVVLVFPVSGTTKTWELREDNLKKLQDLYPATDALAVCKKALFWVENNPKNKKTAPRMLQWLGSVWLDRDQNRAKGPGIKSPESERAETHAIQERIRREREQQQKRLDDYKRSGKQQRPG